ncbi:hypothetical protein GTQ34_16010 [Muricauda sp. JGD-17]|uniref:Uncharacterized protein n=1 Tax=Flagellimonas ochracea TaxID=2696472 RepID=A0A964WYN6_9FLAO|nr:hypothetical protein [Allomuricauda ochracea]NAY93416.1 hypothetical protein [Allomuricauda ochracea]
MKHRNTFRPFRLLQSGMLIALLFAVVSCGQKTFDSEAQLLEYIRTPDNGYHYEKTVGNVQYALTYRPTDILVKQELHQDLDKRNIDSLRGKYGKYLYFNLGMSVNDQELLSSKAHDRDAFGLLVNQLSFDMGEKVHLISDKRDTIPLLDYVYPRMYSMSNSTNMLLVYPKNKGLLEGDQALFTIEDLGFSTGEVSFKIPLERIRKEPKLSLEL